MDFENVTAYENISSASGSEITPTGTNWFLPCFHGFASSEDIVRTGAEVIMLLGACAYLIGAARESHYLGASMFFENLVREL